MPSLIRTKDNSEATVEEWQLGDLMRIAGKPIGQLCAENSGLLLFPEKLDQHNDKIGNSAIFDLQGNAIKTGNIMGYVQTGDIKLKIGSRFDEDGEDLFMQYMLTRVLALNVFDMEADADSDMGFDLPTLLFPFYLKRAIRQGVYKEYKTTLRNDTSLRGTLDVSRHIRLNHPVPTRIAYRAREFAHDNPLTQLIRHTIEAIAQKPCLSAILKTDTETTEAVMAIRAHTPSYNRRDRTSVINKNLRAKGSPYFSDYEPLRHLCLKILRQEEMSFAQDGNAVLGVLFDGAWLWEEYLDTLLRPLGIRHPQNKTQTGRIYLFEGKEAQRYPDFIWKGHEASQNWCIIMDAKYKAYQIIDDAGREDLAQIISYLYVEKGKAGFFISPSREDKAPTKRRLRGYGAELGTLTLNVSTEGHHSLKDYSLAMSNREKAFVDIVRGLPSATELPHHGNECIAT